MTANKAKFSTMVALFAVALLMWGRLLLKQVPKTAVATPAVSRSAGGAALPTLRPGKPGRAGPVPVASELARDLFALDPTAYHGLEIPGSTADSGKSGSKPTDEGETARRVREAASSLDLQSTLQDGRASAVISGKLLLIGHEIHGFTLRSVSQRRAILERDGIEVELEL